MKKNLYCAFALTLASALSMSAVAQTEDSKSADRPTIKTAIAACGCCTEGGASQTSPVILALDLDKDGQISALEIKNAVQSLSALDGDGNGRLSRDEMHAKSEFSNVNAAANSTNAAKTAQQSKLQLGATVEMYVDKMLHKYDLDNNGRIEKSEMPERFLAVLDKIDGNKDDVLTKTELLNINNQLIASYRAENLKKQRLQRIRASKTRQQKSKSSKQKPRGSR